MDFETRWYTYRKYQSAFLTLQKTLVNNGVRVGGMSEEDLRTILDQM